MNDTRFSGNLGKEYDIFYQAVPYLLGLEKELGKILKEYIDKHWPQDFDGKIMVYDGGCGTGTTTEVALEADKRIHVIAIDNESVMLSQAREKLQKYKDRVTFIEADLLEAVKGFKDIQVFVSGFTIHNLSLAYRANLFKELGRVIVPCGLFINVDKVARNDETMHQKDLQAEFEMFKYFGKHGHPELEKGWTEHYLEDDKIRLTEKEYKDALENSGFKDVRFQSREYIDVIAITEKI